MPSTLPTAPLVQEAIPGLPVDVCIEVLEHCSPMQLVDLYATSPVLRGLVNTRTRIWDESRHALARGRCKPVPTCPNVVATGNFSFSAYFTWIFHGGKCSACGQFTRRQPENFILNIRTCSIRCAAAASNLILRIDWDDETHWFHDAEWTGWLVSYMESAEDDDTEPKYIVVNKAQILDVQAKWQQAAALDAEGPRAQALSDLFAELQRRRDSELALSGNGIELGEWLPDYHAEKKAVYARNIKFLKQVTAPTRVPFAALMRTGTLTAIFAAFNRDLAPITMTVWFQNEAAILAEEKLTRVAVYNCPHCSRSFVLERLVQHVVDSHSEHDPDELPEKPASMNGKKHCRQCPRSHKVYTETALFHHRAVKHRGS